MDRLTDAEREVVLYALESAARHQVVRPDRQAALQSALTKLSTPGPSFFWLSTVYDLADKGSTDAAIDQLFGKVDAYLQLEHCASEWHMCEGVRRLCEAIDVARLDEDLLVAVLAITHVVRHLPPRAQLVARVARRLREILPEEEAAELLKGQG